MIVEMRTTAAGVIGAILISLMTAVFGCGSESGPKELGRLAASREEPAQCGTGAHPKLASFNDQTAYRIRPGDTLAIVSYLNPEFDQEMVVRPDGKVSLKELGDVAAAGLSPAQLGDQLNQGYLRELRNPAMTVKVKDTPSRRIYVQGQVHRPGPLSVQPHMSALEAITEAGGFTDDADTNKIVVIRRDGCGNPHTAELDLSKSDVADQNAELLPSDIVVVPRTGIANVDLFVKQYVTELLPAQPSVNGTIGH